jgi:hypothetical protein
MSFPLQAQKDSRTGISDYGFAPYPEIHIAMTGVRSTREELKNTVSGALGRAALLNGLKAGRAEPCLTLGEIFQALMEKSGPRVKAGVLIGRV